jgi:phospholipase C
MAQNLANPNITHVFVLMLENRSFDHMLGFSGLSGIDPATGQSTTIEGVNATNTNTYLDISYPATQDADNVMPFDPGHEFLDVVEQLCGAGVSYKGGDYPPINNSGFVSNYATTKSSGEGGATTNFGEIMKCYNGSASIPVMTALAEQFAVCDHWHASLPGPTWPNRFFVHAASSGGLDHSPRSIETLEWETLKGFSFPGGTIYDLMKNNPGTNKGWRIYRGVSKPLIGALPCVAGLKGILLSDTHPYEHFESDINGSYPYSYTFIEPNYGDIINNSYRGGQSQHPMDDVRNGEALIKSTYEAIRSSPLWLNSLLLITYDEHGGFYDHVIPPAAIAPGDTVPKSKYNQYGFPFQQYGVRVSALVISAYTPKNTISHILYDHSSVPATLEALFKLPSLTQRDKAANNVTGLASLPSARADTPEKLPDLPVAPATALVETATTQPMPDENTTPIDSGNLPGFIHIVMKAQLEQEPVASPKLALLDRFTVIRTKADARQYLNENLPSLLR